MKKLIYGLKSLLVKPTIKKIIGFIIPVIIMLTLFANRQFMAVKYPIIFILLFWGAIPAYIYFLGTIYEKPRNQVDIYKSYNNDHENSKKQNNMYDQVSHIEKKTTVTNTTITTETVYFKEGSNYIE